MERTRSESGGLLFRPSRLRRVYLQHNDVFICLLASLESAKNDSLAPPLGNYGNRLVISSIVDRILIYAYLSTKTNNGNTWKSIPSSSKCIETRSSSPHPLHFQLGRTAIVQLADPEQRVVLHGAAGGKAGGDGSKRWVEPVALAATGGNSHGWHIL